MNLSRSWVICLWDFNHARIVSCTSQCIVKKVLSSLIDMNEKSLSVTISSSKSGLKSDSDVSLSLKSLRYSEIDLSLALG